MSSVHTHLYRAFLERLRAARKAAKLTQAQVAERLGRPQSYVSKSESGERRVDIIELDEFAQVYDRSLTYFVPKRPPRPARPSDATPPTRAST